MKALIIAMLAVAAIVASGWVFLRPFKTQDTSCGLVSNVVPCVCSENIQSFTMPVVLTTMAYRGEYAGMAHGLHRADGSAYDRYFHYSNGRAKLWESDSSRGSENPIIKPEGMYKSLGAYAECRYVLKRPSAPYYGKPKIQNVTFIQQVD